MVESLGRIIVFPCISVLFANESLFSMSLLSLFSNLFGEYYIIITPFP